MESTKLSMLSRILIAGVVTLFGALVAYAKPISPTEIRVRDGDTIVAHGVTYRMIGYDTPEISSRWRKVERMRKLWP
ncbi:hypothetical protein LMTR3_20890 [Bradyrhizobium sp. LMTR 3]|nr:hypothetical protein LMTR3_20890 [Bradyrhizobium sp. LMTR 3]